MNYCINTKVSIVIPVYNGSNYMREAIDSALAQTYTNCEVLVINDGSTDNGATRDIALSYGDRIRYFEKENGGVASALNLGIREMAGEYFSWLSHDDVYYPDKLEKQLEFMADRSDVILYGGYENIDSSSKVIASPPSYQIPDGSFRGALLINHIVHGCTTLVPRKCFENVGMFDESLRTTQDYDMWFRLATVYSFVKQDRIITQSRVHQEQGTWTITSHRSEVDSLYSNCICKLSPRELINLFGVDSLSSAYVKLARNMAGRGYLKAADLSIRLAWQKNIEFGFENIFDLIVCAVFFAKKTFTTALRSVVNRFY